MEYASLALAAVALVLAYTALGKAKAAHAGLEDARADTRRQARNVAEALRRELFIMQQFLIRQVSGETLTVDMVREGLLWRDIDSEEGMGLVKNEPNLVIVDVRSPEETAEGVIPGAICIPVDEIQDRKLEIPKVGQPVMIYCAGGGRSLGVCEDLSHEGYERLHNLTGGFMNWKGDVSKPS